MRPVTLELRSAPHVLSGRRTETIMWSVVAALAPATLFGIWAFGLAAALVVLVAVGVAVGVEYLAFRGGWSAGRPNDGSAVLTGLLFALTLPPSLPLWMVVVGVVFGMVVGKLAFGGLGSNLFNPALVGRAFLQATFPVAMTTWALPFVVGRAGSLPTSTLALPLMRPTWDALSGPTALSSWKYNGVATGATDLWLGLVPGSIGETSVVALVVGALFLVARRMLAWETPLSIFATVAALAAGLHAWQPERFAGAAFMVGAGGLALGALFMATDPVASPITRTGRVVYGVLIGALVVAIRVAGGMPEGVMYAILLGNAVCPLIDQVCKPRPLGAPR